MPKGNRVIIKSIVFLITTLSPSLIDSAKQLIINVLTLGNSSFKIKVCLIIWFGFDLLKLFPFFPPLIYYISQML